MCHEALMGSFAADLESIRIYGFFMARFGPEDSDREVFKHGISCKCLFEVPGRVCPVYGKSLRAFKGAQQFMLEPDMQTVDKTTSWTSHKVPIALKVTPITFIVCCNVQCM